jgi:hypothetical protein
MRQLMKEIPRRIFFEKNHTQIDKTERITMSSYLRYFWNGMGTTSRVGFMVMVPVGVGILYVSCTLGWQRRFEKDF